MCCVSSFDQANVRIFLRNHFEFEIINYLFSGSFCATLIKVIYVCLVKEKTKYILVLCLRLDYVSFGYYKLHNDILYWILS